jgi:hypothetical protein
MKALIAVAIGFLTGCTTLAPPPPPYYPANQGYPPNTQVLPQRYSPYQQQPYQQPYTLQQGLGNASQLNGMAMQLLNEFRMWRTY